MLEFDHFVTDPVILPPVAPSDLVMFREFSAEKWTPEQAAEACGVGRTSWYRWESGKALPPIWLGLVLMAVRDGYRPSPSEDYLLT